MAPGGGAAIRLNLDDLGLRAGQRHTREIDVELAPITVGGERFDAVVPGGVTVTVERIAGGYLIDVGLTAKVCGPCSRCLTESCTEVHAQQQEFIPAVAGAWSESQSETTPFVDDLVLDVGGLTREAVVLALPDRILCRDECKGLCPGCGVDLNKGDCLCSPLEE